MFSTESPRNSRRSLCSAPKLRWVSARFSSAGSAKRCPSRCCSDSMPWPMARADASPSVRLALVLDQQIDRLDQGHFLVVGEADHEPLVLLRDLQVLARDAGD